MQVDADACLEWLPKETIVFNGAIYRQDLRIELSPGARWLGWEITRLGRSARRKVLQGEWRSHTEIGSKAVPCGLTDNGYQLGKKLSTVLMAWLGSRS